jgi:hypothetical protein
MPQAKQVSPEELIVLGYIVRSSIFPALAVIVVMHEGKPGITFPGANEVDQVDGIESEEDLLKKSNNYIPLRQGEHVTFAIGRDIAFAFNKEDIALMPGAALCDELLKHALTEKDEKIRQLYHDVAEDIRLHC